MSATRTFLRIVDWDDFQYSGSHKKPDPPWRWCRLPRTLIDSPEFQALTWPQRGAFCWLLMLASETGNMIPDEPGYLLNRIQLRSKLKLNLIQSGLIQSFELPADSPEIRKLRRVYSGPAPSPEGEGEGEEETDTEKGKNNVAGATTAVSSAPDFENQIPLSPPHPDVQETIKRIAGEKRTGNARKRSANGKDPRTFDELKASILEVSRKLRSTDRQLIWNCSRQSLGMSERQFETAFKQLLEDGAL